MTNSKPNNSFFQLTGNQLKLFALFAMTLDHVGKQLLPQYDILQIIGRLAFPIFAYMIAEGCRYTKNRRKYLLTITSLALLCQLVYFLAMGSLYMCILVTFTLSICIIYAIDYALEQKTFCSWLMAVIVCGAVYFISVPLPRLLYNTDFAIDYGIFGILLSVFVYFAKTKYGKLFMAALSLFALCLTWGGIQWYSLLALIPLIFYNGERGKAKFKNLFYIYYPLHLVCIYLISLLL